MSKVYRIWDATECNQTKLVYANEDEAIKTVDGMNGVTSPDEPLRYYYVTENEEPFVGALSLNYFKELLSKIGFTYFH